MVFSSNEDLDSSDQQTSLIPTVEEVVREEEAAGEDAGSEQQFGVFKDFDFLDVELEDAEVRKGEGGRVGHQNESVRLLQMFNFLLVQSLPATFTVVSSYLSALTPLNLLTFVRFVFPLATRSCR